MIQTKNFNPSTDSKLLCTCGHTKCDKRSVNQFSLDKLQLIREDIGLPLVVTSGGRCPYHPNEVDKAKEGDHQKCFGVDIYYDNILVRNKLMVLGLSAIGHAPLLQRLVGLKVGFAPRKAHPVHGKPSELSQREFLPSPFSLCH